MSAPFRTHQGGRPDRARTLRFTFDGRTYDGHPGDTLASALLAHGVHLTGRSFKYHRPRGILSAGPEEPNALVELDAGPGRREPNSRATMVPLRDGLLARSQNRWPSLAWDAGALTGAAAALLPAGFYYKTFMGPGRAWEKLYEPLIRRMAGLGRAPAEADPDRYAQRYAHCDVLVVGAGPAGLAAALAAARGGARVILCDEQMEMGGSLLSQPGTRIAGLPGWEWLEVALAELRALKVRLLPRTTAFSYGLQNMVSLAELPERAEGPRERLWMVRAARVVLATGAIERPLPFSGNDRPGVMLADAARVYALRYGVLAGHRAAVLAAHDSGYEAAFALQAAGMEIAAILDPRAAPPADLLAEATGRGIRVLAGQGVARSLGGRRVTGLISTGGERIGCDLLLMAGGWTPSVHLFSQARGALRWDAARDAYLPDTAPEAVLCAGACQGSYGLGACLAEGHAAGGGHGAAPGAQPGREPSGMPTAQAVAGAAKAPMAFVDFQNDVQAKDIALAVREGFRSIEHVKRYTTNGMATDQGKTSNMVGLAIAAATLGQEIPAVGLTRYRHPVTPTGFGGLAGRHRGDLFEPIRRAPLHGWAEAEGALFEPVAQWRRARAFPRAGEDLHAAVLRECRAVRQAAGIFDASTLGKIEVVGPDAAEFLERLYVNPWKKLAPGRCRYGIMLREDGFVTDDGVVGRMAADRFHVTTTTGGAARVLHMMEDYLQTEFPELRVWLTSTTEQWAVIALQGPKARTILEPFVEGLDISAASFPHMSVAACRVMGIPARLFRVSFTGELGFEVNVAPDQAPALWRALMRAGAPHGLTPYGTEAMHVLRAEKGYIIVSQETDGTVTPDDAGLSWAVGKAKRDFVGKRSLARPEMRRRDRPQLVGLLPRGTVPQEGAQILASPGARMAEGHVTSAYWSPALDRPIALGLLAGGRERMGQTVYATVMGGAPIAMEVTDPVFLDKAGERVNA
ncbi:sarcosine oxidase subunit alpha family protein [Rhodovarius lipocyclicus]|uniref:sarcosine oxidase subunit alpha family protein n=1 Tax=Rhodovarius lipocyclicus TaxID=268410 RepID=UPI00135834F1|nr:sarcosine oxidase subunit alpha family protein [Rhodovarius lipocyclicus]